MADARGYDSGGGGAAAAGNLSLVGIVAMTTGNMDNATDMPGWNESTTICLNEYCLSNEDYKDMIRDYIVPKPYEWVVIALYFVTFVVGLVGNFLVCFAVWRNDHMRTVTNYFIVNLSVADFLVILICLPPTVLGDVTETWFMGRIMCKIIKYLQGASVSVSVLTLTAISVERWYAICYPLSFRSTARKVRLAILCIWITALLLLLPELIVLDTERLLPAELTDLLMVCRPTWSSQRQAAFQLFLIIVLFFMPFCLMGLCYIAIARCLWTNVTLTEQTNRPLNSTSGHDQAARQLQSRRNVAKMLISVVIMFGVCYLPVHMLNILRYFGTGLPSGEKATLLALAAHWLCYFNSALNPVIYNFMSAKFRSEFVRICRCCVVCCPDRKRHRNPYADSTFNSYKYSYGNSVTHTEHVTLSTIKPNHADVAECAYFSDD